MAAATVRPQLRDFDLEEILMPVFLLTYDLNRPGQDYDGLIDELKRTNQWWHYLKSTWLLYTTETSDQLWNRVRPHVDDSDRVLICPVTQPARGWLPQEAWDWINRYI